LWFWGVEEVGRELERMGCGRYRGRWREEGVDGETLWFTERREELERMGVGMEGHRGKIWSRVEEWKVMGVEVEGE